MDPEIIPAILEAYPTGNISSQVAGGNSQYDRISEVATLLAFQCGMALLANQTTHSDIPVWRYYYNATFPNISPLSGELGVYHSSEISLVWGTYPGGPVFATPASAQGLLPQNLPATAQQAALSQYMNAAWANFAKDPHAGPGWNALGTFNYTDLAVLGANGSSGATLISRQEVDAQCHLLLPVFKTLSGPAYGLPNYNASTT